MSAAETPTLDDASVGRAIEIATRLGVLLLLAAWCFDIVKIFIGPVAWGIIIAIAAYTPFLKIKQALGDRNRIAATVFILLGLLVLIVPSAMLSETMVGGASRLTQAIESDSLKVPPPPESVAGWPLIGQQLDDLWQLASVNLQEALNQFNPQLKALALGLLGAIGSAGLGLLQFVISIIIAGILLASADGGRDFAYAFARRLAGDRGDELAETARGTIVSVASGILGIALLQSILAGVGFIAVDLPGAGLWAMLVLLFAIVQLPVTVLMIGPIVWVFSYASTPVAVMFAIWSVIVGAGDGFLKPLMLGRGLKVPMLVIFVGAIGGMASSGIIGLFIGSVVLAVGYEIFRAWLFLDEESGESPAAAPSEA